MDLNHDGVVTWSEWWTQFLLKAKAKKISLKLLKPLKPYFKLLFIKWAGKDLKISWKEVEAKVKGRTIDVKRA